jgi:hypothetical protein
MTPDQIAAVQAVASILSQVGTWPIGTVLFAVIIGPWIIVLFVSRSQDRRFEAVIEMYKNNVKLVENYEMIASEQADMIRLSTAATTELTTYLRTRTPCHQLINRNLGATTNVYPK